MLGYNGYELTPILIQVQNLLPARRQHLLAPLYTAIQAQASRIPLLGLPPKGSTAGHPEIRRPKQEEAQAHSPATRPLRRQDQNHRVFPGIRGRRNVWRRVRTPTTLPILFAGR